MKEKRKEVNASSKMPPFKVSGSGFHVDCYQVFDKGFGLLYSAMYMPDRNGEVVYTK